MKPLLHYSFTKALRPFSLVVAIVSCGLGCFLAWQAGFQSGLLLILIMLGGVLAQSGINLINDIEDLALIPLDHNEYSLIEKMIKRNAKAGFICFVLATLIGSYLVLIQGLMLFFLILISGLASLSYNIGPINFKQRGLSIIQVFLLMGVFMVQGSYLAMSGNLSTSALLHSIPISLLISLLLLSNELRDWEVDKSNKVQTLAVRIGYTNSVKLYWSLIALSYLVAITYFYIGYLHTPLWLLLPLPLLLLIKRYLQAPQRIQLTPMTGRFFFLFGLAYLFAL